MSMIELKIHDIGVTQLLSEVANKAAAFGHIDDETVATCNSAIAHCANIHGMKTGMGGNGVRFLITKGQS